MLSADLIFLSLAGLMAFAAAVGAVLVQFVPSRQRIHRGGSDCRSPNVAGREALLLIRAGIASARNALAREWLGDGQTASAQLGPLLELEDPDALTRYLRDCIDPVRSAAPSRIFAAAQGRSYDIAASADGWELSLSIVEITDVARRIVQAERATAKAEREADTMADMALRAPILQWMIDEDGRVAWSNAEMVERQEGTPETLTALMSLPVERENGEARHVVATRVSVPDPNRPEGASWFELNCVPRADGAVLCYATPIQRLIAAEDSLSRFVETLTETFAHLPTGLAIFDRNRELGLFNPALAGLLGLDPAWLAGRPGLSAILAHLRERRAIPDQSDFASWRQTLLSVGRDDGPDRYEEVWTQPSGRTLHVTVRPHPHGAIAFLVADITTDLELERQYRARTDMRDAVLSLSDSARLIVDTDGLVRYASPHFSDLMNGEEAMPFGAMLERLQSDHDVVDEADMARVRRFAARAGQVDAVLVAPLGPARSLKLRKLRGGATLVTVREDQPVASRLKETGSDRAGAILTQLLKNNDHLLDMVVVAPPDLDPRFADIKCDRVDLLRRVAFNMLLCASELGRDGGALSIQARADDSTIGLITRLSLAHDLPAGVDPAQLLPVTLLRRYLEVEAGRLDVYVDDAITVEARLPLSALRGSPHVSARSTMLKRI